MCKYEKEGREDKNNGIKIKLCRAAGATKTQIHSKANIQCIIVMCLVVCYVFVLHSGGSYGKVRHVGKCLVTSDVSWIKWHKVIMHFVTNFCFFLPFTSFILNSQPTLSVSPSHLSSVLINDSITHNFHFFYFKFIFQTDWEKKSVFK